MRFLIAAAALALLAVPHTPTRWRIVPPPGKRRPLPRPPPGLIRRGRKSALRRATPFRSPRPRPLAQRANVRMGLSRRARRTPARAPAMAESRSGCSLSARWRLPLTRPDAAPWTASRWRYHPLEREPQSARAPRLRSHAGHRFCALGPARLGLWCTRNRGASQCGRPHQCNRACSRPFSPPLPGYPRPPRCTPGTFLPTGAQNQGPDIPFITGRNPWLFAAPYAATMRRVRPATADVCCLGLRGASFGVLCLGNVIGVPLFGGFNEIH